MTKTNGLHGWLSRNAFPMFVFLASAFVGSIIGFAVLRGQVQANAQSIEGLEENIAQYPSEDWFELKFEEIEKRFDSIEESVDNAK